MAQNPFEKALVDEGLVGTPLESLARSIYMQESGAGRNTKTSNAGAVGGMQILPGTFNEMLPGGNINDPYDNSRAGLRYIKQMYDKSGGDLNLTAVGYYGGPGGMQKAKQGVAVSDPRNPNAPTTLEYAKQVLSRTDNKDSKTNQPVSRETLKPEKIIAEAGQGYQAAYALMSMADEEPENEREIAAREAAEEQSAATQFAQIQKQLASVKPASPFAAQGPEEVQQFSKGGEATADDDEETETARRDFQMFLKKATREESPLDVKFMTPDPRPMVQEGLGVVPAAPPSVMGRVGYKGDNFRAGASGVAVKTPQGVKVMPGMYDIGYRMPMAGGELDMSYSRGIKSMPGMPTPQMANVRYVRKFEKGGEAQADAQGSSGGFERWVAKKIGVDKAWDKSLDAPYEMGLSEDSGTRGDAVRHMVLMREIEKKYNPTVAKTLGYAHEFIGGPMQYFSQGNAQSSRDREMDLRNNALGLELSKQAGGDDAKFRELMRQALENKQADFYREEYTGKRKAPGATQVRKRAGGSPEEGETKSSAKDMLKEVGRSTQYLPYDLVGAPVDVINLGLKGIDYVTGSKLSSEKPVGGSEYLIEKSRQAGIADKPTGSLTETLTRFGTGLITPGGVVKGVEMAKRSGSTAKKMLDEVKTSKMAPDEIDPAVAKEIMEAKTGPRTKERTSILPTEERPFVGQLERIAADMNPATVEQFRNMVAKTGRDYEIERLNRALEGLGPKDKITSKIMLERLENTLPPSKYKFQLIEPNSPEKGWVTFHQDVDNPYPSKQMGTINLKLDKTPEESMQASYFGNLENAISDIKNTNPVTFTSGTPRVIDYGKAEKDIEMFLTMPEFKGTPLAQMFKQDLPEITRLRKEAGLMETLTDTYLYPNTHAKQVYREAYPELKDIPDWQNEASNLMKNSREKNVSLRMDTAQDQANQVVQEKVLDKINEMYGVDLRPQLNTPEMQALDATARAEAAKILFARKFASDYLGKQSQLNQILSKYKTPAFEQITQNMPYAGKHTSIVKDNPISFSRFVDLELPDSRKGMLITELQADRFKAVKEGTAPEAYPGMAKSPQVIQQLMIKNAVQGGIKRNTDVVLFPGSDSSQAQLYEKLPNNIRAVLKDLGPGFKMEKIAVPNEKGDIIERYGITWDKKAAERLQREGIRFAKGGFVEKKY
jgi:SLT domain-containing protein